MRKNKIVGPVKGAGRSKKSPTKVVSFRVDVRLAKRFKIVAYAWIKKNKNKLKD